MSDRLDTFGRMILAQPSQLLALEVEHRAGIVFEEIDEVVATVLARGLHGETVITHRGGPRGNDDVSVAGLDTRQRKFLDSVFSLEGQNSQGAWYFPERASVSIGMANFPAHFRQQDRFAWGATIAEKASVIFKTASDAVFSWAMLEPLFERLFEVFALRGHRSGTMSREDAQRAWASATENLSAMGFQVGDQLSPMRSGRDWSTMAIAEQLDVKRALLSALGNQVGVDKAKHYRASALVTLVQRYYESARNGAPKKKQVLTKPYQRLLSAFFGGSWLAFLEYIGEPPHPDEQIITALPKVRPFVRAKRQVKEIAAAQGVSPDAVRDILSTYWAETGTSSPVERRVAALRKYWSAFDEVHARQLPGKPSLWGLVDEGGFITFDDVWRSPYTPGLYRDFLSADLIVEIDRLWGTTVLERFPDRVVSEPFPHTAMAQTFGAALRVWHGCALTAWFLCEGPSSRTDMAGLSQYHAADVDILQELQCPIPRDLFEELRLGETKLGPPQEIVDRSSKTEVFPGVSIRIQTSSGTRREGFEFLRDIITKHRRAWAEGYLDSYLHARWETEIRGAAERFHRMLADRGKPPTLKQFMKFGAGATNHWFGGDVSGLYATIREKAPRMPTRETIMPADRVGFTWSVFCALGGQPFERRSLVANPEEAKVQVEAQQRNHQLKRLAEESLWYLQLSEALGQAPTVDQFGRSGFGRIAEPLSKDVETAWSIYGQAIARASGEPIPPAEAYRSPGVVVSKSASPPSPGQIRGELSQPSEATPHRRSWLDRLLRR